MQKKHALKYILCPNVMNYLRFLTSLDILCVGVGVAKY